MKHPRIIVTIVGVAAAGLIGAATIAATAGGSTPQAASKAGTSVVKPAPTATTGTMPTTASVAGTASPTVPATIRTATATVGGRSETILVNAKGLPLYYYKPDTASSSMVTGSLATLWPPLVATAPTATGANGTLKVVNTSNGHQVTYNGHFLYTFEEDGPGQVTGQGVQDFFVATPGITARQASSAPRATAPSASTGSGYGY